MKHILTAISLCCAAAIAWAQSPNDAQIAAIVVTANQVDIDAGELARTKAKSKEVKEFAELMVTDHSSVNKSAMDLAKKLDLKPEDNPTAQTLKRGGGSKYRQTEAAQGGGLR
ncbi:Membrane protein [Cupriavidus sp. H18C1]